jgi:hypothetical protein
MALLNKLLKILFRTSSSIVAIVSPTPDTRV